MMIFTCNAFLVSTCVLFIYLVEIFGRYKWGVTVVVQDQESEDDDEPLSVRQKKLAKEPKKRNAEGSTQDNSGNVSLPKPVVVIAQDTQLTPSTTQPRNSPLQFLEQHLGGELSKQTETTNLVQNPSIHPISEQIQNLIPNINQTSPEDNLTLKQLVSEPVH